MPGTAEVTGDVKKRIAAELEAARARTIGAARAVLGRRADRSRCRRSCRRSSGTSRTSATSRSCGSRGGSAAQRRSSRTRTTRTTHSPTRARSGPRSSCSTRATPRAYLDDVRARSLAGARGDRARSLTTRCSAAASPSASSSSTSSSTSRRCCRRSSSRAASTPGGTPARDVGPAARRSSRRARS